MGKLVTTESWIKKAKEVHGDEYNYDKVEYVSSHKKICIICRKHGEFWQTPNSHLNGRGCPICCNEKKGITTKDTTETFIEKAREVHGDKYDYSKVDYKNSKTKVCIVCPEHGEFYMRPIYHVFNKCECQICSNAKRIKQRSDTTETFIEKSREVHGDKYDYSKVDYKNNHTKVCIICPEHGEFYMKPQNHTASRQGCPKCNGNIKLTKEEFIEKSKKIHGDRYDYSGVEYVNYVTKVSIVCKKHGEFWQTPHSHLSGQGCPKCSQSKLERQVRDTLEAGNYVFEEQKNFDWLKFKNSLRLDFYLEKYNLAIECQGLQHYKAIDTWGGEKSFKDVKERDKIKKQKCQEHGINILYIKYNDTKKEIENLINEIRYKYVATC